MRLLALDTASAACTVALVLGPVTHERHAIAPRRHAELVLPMIDELLAEAGIALAGLDAIAFGRGPGSFTGVRIACGVVQGLALGAALPVAPVSTLAALAEGARRERGERRILAGFDARMGEVYWGAFVARDGIVSAAGEEVVCRPEDVPIPREAGHWVGVGDAWAVYGDALARRLGRRLSGVDPARFPAARDVAALGAALLTSGGGRSVEAALPRYLRDRVTRPAGSGGAGGAGVP